MGFGDDWTARRRVAFVGTFAFLAVGSVVKLPLLGAVIAGVVGWSWRAAAAGAVAGLVAYVIRLRRTESVVVPTAVVAAAIGLMFLIGIGP